MPNSRTPASNGRNLLRPPARAAEVIVLRYPRIAWSETGTGTGFDTDSVTITIPDSPGGLHDPSVRYRAPYGQKVTSLQLNGAGLGDDPGPAVSSRVTRRSAGFRSSRSGPSHQVARLRGEDRVPASALQPAPKLLPFAWASALETLTRLSGAGFPVEDAPAPPASAERNSRRAERD